MNMLNKFPEKSNRTASRIIENEAVIVIPEEGLVRVLNKTGSRIWQLIGEKRTTGDIINIISDEFDVAEDVARKDVLDFIAELKEKNMVVLKEE